MDDSAEADAENNIEPENSISDALGMKGEENVSDITDAFVENLLLENLTDLGVEFIDPTSVDSENISDLTDTCKTNDSNEIGLENYICDTNDNELEAIDDITAADFENHNFESSQTDAKKEDQSD